MSETKLEIALDAFSELRVWCDAYPLKSFPEPDWEKARKVLKENGMTIDSISASNFRHVLKSVRRITDDAIKKLLDTGSM